MAGIVSKTYGHALFSLALELNEVETLREEARLVSDVIAQTEELLQFYSHPKISMDEKKAVTESCFKGRVSDSMTGFLLLVVENGRQTELLAILEAFEEEVKEHLGIGVAYVTTARELQEDQRTKLVARLIETTKYSSFEMHYQVDAAVIGGIVVQIGNRVLDSSIRTQLNKMSKSLQQVQLS